MNTSVFPAAAVLMLVTVPAAASAQGVGARPERPYRGVFASTPANPAQLLTISATIGGGYDDNALTDAGGDRALGSSGPGRARSAYGRVGGDIGYSLNLTRVSLTAAAAGVGRYFPRLGDEILASYTGNVGASFQLAEGTRVRASQSIDYMPSFAFAPFPGLFDVPMDQNAASLHELGASRQDVLTHAWDVDLMQNLGRRSTVALSYRSHVTTFDSPVSELFPIDDLRTQSAAGHFTLALTKGLGLRLGYGYRDARYGDDGSRAMAGQTIDAGVDFSRALSLTRRTTLSFGAGTSAVRGHEESSYRLTGFARLEREIGRTWRASVVYDRNFSFVEALEEPLLHNTATFVLTGLITRRLEFWAKAGASVGAVGTSGGYDTYFGSVGMARAFNRYVAVGADYTYYRYAFDTGVRRPPGLPAEMGRQSAHIYLKLWAPLVSRARRTDAAR